MRRARLQEAQVQQLQQQTALLRQLCADLARDYGADAAERTPVFVTVSLNAIGAAVHAAHRQRA